MIKSYLYLERTAHKGKAVFTHEKIAANTVIEMAPVIVMSKEDRQHLDKTLLHDYIFEWGKQKDKCAMALGFIPIYNHSYKSNCEYFMDFEEDTILVKTVRAIKKGEELTINYNGDWNDSKSVWFEVR
ncbi:MAG: SET domain-containing protein-lysine N-methyltransferase [Ferruginibacter sp.]